MKTYALIAILVITTLNSLAQQQDNEVTLSPEHKPVIITDKPDERFSFSKDGTISENLNERKLYTGNVRKKKLDGNWESWYQNGQLCDSGKLELGLPDGEWKHWDEHGQLIAVRNYSSDKYNRIKNELTRYNPRQAAYPLTVMYQKNSSAASKYLHSSYSFPHNIRRIDDQSLQEWVAANIASGAVYHPVFDQSLHHGLYMNFFPDGIVKDSGYYQNGLRQGVWIQRQFVHGLYYVGAYKNGLKIKEWRAYMPSGKLMGIIFYNNKGEEESRRRIDQ
jgi:hypothetical protein